MVKPINWGGMLEPYLQPLKERLGILPLGQYEDGSVRLAWPGLLADPVQHGMRAAETPIPPVDDDAAWAAKSRDFFDAAGLATTGALGANMAGGMVDNALGSAGAKLTRTADDELLAALGFTDDDIAALAKDMPQSKPSGPVSTGSRKVEGERRDNAISMGFDPDAVWYRGLRHPYEDDWKDKGFHYQMFTSSPDDAGGYALANDWAKPQVIPAHVRPGNTLEIDAGTNNFNSVSTASLPQDIRSSLGSGAASIDQIAHAAKLRGYDSITVRNVMDNVGGERTGKPADVHVALDPRNIRSVNAAFDPAKSDSANLLAANAKSGAAVPLAIDAAESQAPQGIRAYRGAADGTAATPRSDQFWAAADPSVADSYAMSGGNLPSVAPVDMRFQNPATVDARGAFYDSIPYNGQRLTSDELLQAIRQQGNDGLILNNVRDDLSGNGNPTSVYAAAQPGTVYSATTGNLLYSNAPTASAIPLGMEGQEQDPQTLTTANILRLLRGQ